MKILAPLADLDHFEKLVDAGADEFYCGMVPYEWIEKYGFDLNRREFRSNAAFNSITSIKILKEKANAYRIPIKLTLNSLLYSQGQYEMILDLIKQYMELGFDTYIIADLGLFVFLRENGIACKVHISGEMPAINTETIDLLMQYGFTRVIFPRRMSITDMEGCIQKYGSILEYESFILNEGCVYTGAFCNTIHCDELKNACYLPYNINLINKDKHDFHLFFRYLQMIKARNSKRDNIHAEQHIIGESGCGLCYIKKLREIGITNLKIVGRGRNVNNLIEDIVSVNKALQLTDQYSQDDYKQKILDVFFDGQCKNSYVFCYYPQNEQVSLKPDSSKNS